MLSDRPAGLHARRRASPAAALLLSVAVFPWLSPPTPVAAQGLGSASILGEVVDGAGQPVGLARVEARYIPTGAVASVSTGHSVAPGQTLSAAYFRRAGRNRAQNRGKARDAQAVSLDDLNEEVLGSGRRPAPGASRRPHRLEALRDAIRRLPEPERSVARLCELEGWKVPEVAIVLGLSERTVKRRKADSKTLLEADLGLPPPP